MTENLYKALEELNDTMYDLDYDMGQIADVRTFSNKLERLTKITNGLLNMNSERFKQTIEEFDKIHFADLQ